jgi:hypothetical protein
METTLRHQRLQPVQINLMRAYWIFCVVFLSGCANNNALFLKAAKTAIGKLKPSETVVLDPAYHYMRVTVGKQHVYLVLASRDPTPQGLLDTWYSGEGEVIKLMAGRIVSTYGLPTDWRAVRTATIPSWKSVLKSSRVYSRQRDVMPGYHYGLEDRITMQAIMPPKRTSLINKRTNQLVWFEEKTATQYKGEKIPTAIYAIDFSNHKERVVYSVQCLNSKLCLAFEEVGNEPTKTMRGAKSL